MRSTWIPPYLQRQIGAGIHVAFEAEPRELILQGVILRKRGDMSDEIDIQRRPYRRGTLLTHQQPCGTTADEDQAIEQRTQRRGDELDLRDVWIGRAQINSCSFCLANSRSLALPERSASKSASRS